jgi:hypothetical protein
MPQPDPAASSSQRRCRIPGCPHPHRARGLPDHAEGMDVPPAVVAHARLSVTYAGCSCGSRETATRLLPADAEDLAAGARRLLVRVLHADACPAVPAQGIRYVARQVAA